VSTVSDSPTRRAPLPNNRGRRTQAAAAHWHAYKHRPAEMISVSQLPMVNDEFAEGIAAHPGRFTALATLPLNDPAASVKELDRAIRQLKFRGAMLFSNVNHIALADERFYPLYELANDLEAVTGFAVQELRQEQDRDLAAFGVKFEFAVDFDYYARSLAQRPGAHGTRHPDARRLSPG